MDCDDVTLLLARDGRELADGEATALDAHLASCDACFALVRDPVLALASPPPAGSAAHALVFRPITPDELELGETLATGGMGRILRAFDRRLGREVAVKEVRAPELRARFEREAMITARLQHPAIVPIYDAATWPDGRVFYTMRLVPGETLAEAIAARGVMAERLALLPHAIAAAEAVAYAHVRGVIHRDLKPHNVLVGELGETVVIDWGLAKQRDGRDDDGAALPVEDAVATRAGAIVGTPCFMSPEQARGEPLDERADVFALGALLYHLVVGAPPYWDRSHDSDALLEALRAGPPTPIDALVPGIPVDLRTIIERAMAREPAGRFGDASELAGELRRFQAGQMLVSRAYPLRERWSRWARKHRAAVSIGAAAIAAVAIVGGFALRNAMRARTAEDAAATALETGALREQRKLCDAQHPALASAWDASARQLVARRFASLELVYATPTFERLDRVLVRWSEELAAGRAAACASSAPRAQLGSELACLADNARAARALIAQLHDADAIMVQNAVAAGEALPAAASCTAASPARPPELATPSVDELRRRFAQTHTLLALGKARAALPIAQALVTDADALGDDALRAAARIALGEAQAFTSDFVHATQTLHEGLRLAETARDDRSRAQAWVQLLRIEYQRGKPEQALAMQAAALGAAERIGDVYLQSELMLFLGGAYSQLGKLDDAEVQFTKAVALRRAQYGDHDHRLAAALSSLGNAYAMRGDLERGVALHLEAATIAEAALGGTHPNVGVLLGNLGSDYLYALRTDEALPVLTRSLAIAEAASGPAHRTVASGLTELGTAQLVAGNAEAALATFERADAAWRAVDAMHPTRGEALCGRYQALRALGRPAEVADLETALELTKPLPPFIRARIQLALGKAVTGPRARALVADSAKGFATTTLPLSQRELADARAWLAAHGGA